MKKNIDMKKEWLDVLPDANDYESSIYHLIIDDVEVPFYKHTYVDRRGNVSKHWSRKQILPPNATLEDL